VTHGSRWLVGAAAVFCLVAAPAQAQTPPPQTKSPKPAATPAKKKISHWGIVFSATPQWNLPTFVTNSFAGNGGSVVVVGSQYAIGIVHGRAMGGDWGVTFVHQPAKDGSRGADSDTECGFTNGPITGGCFNTSGGIVTKGVLMNGVEVHKYVVFHTFKRRVQIGMEFAGGIATLSGTFLKTSSDVTNIQFNPKTSTQTAVLTTTVTTEDVTAELPSKVPVGRITLVGALIISPALKVRWEGGMIFPGQSASTVVVTFLFGAHHD